MSQSPQVTILFDNEPGLPGLTQLWGFAALLQIGERRILLDTGSNGRVLLRNMAALGRSAHELDLLFLSHPHWDHIGGLDSVLELNPRLIVVLHEGFSKHLIHDLRSLSGGLVVVGQTPAQLGPGLYSSGLLESDPPEQALLVDHGGVTAVLTGCAHLGIDRMVARAGAVLGKPIDWAIGGFHLMNSDLAAINECALALRDQGVTDVVPTHCTGDLAKAELQRVYGARCHAGGVGRQIRLVRGSVSDVPVSCRGQGLGGLET